MLTGASNRLRTSMGQKNICRSSTDTFLHPRPATQQRTKNGGGKCITASLCCTRPRHQSRRDRHRDATTVRGEATSAWSACTLRACLDLVHGRHDLCVFHDVRQLFLRRGVTKNVTSPSARSWSMPKRTLTHAHVLASAIQRKSTDMCKLALLIDGDGEGVCFHGRVHPKRRIDKVDPPQFAGVGGGAPSARAPFSRTRLPVVADGRFCHIAPLPHGVIQEAGLADKQLHAVLHLRCVHTWGCATGWASYVNPVND